ncbi:MAG: hypothetical protein HYS15_02330 [Candidatus Spechtbacteria bacterium]|nr:hypothetical protein [Candidatus Spechtbacteria bacterium]
MSGFVSFFRNFALTWDAGVVFFLFLAMFFVGLSMGRRRLVLILHSAYLSVALTKLLPFMENFTAGMQKMQKLEIEIGIFWGVTILLFALFSGAHLSSALQITKAEEGSFFQLLLLAFGTAPNFGGQWEEFLCLY